MITALLLIFALVIEYIYDPISNMKDTLVINSVYKKLLNNGALIAHIGVGVLVLGITASSVWKKEFINNLALANNTTYNSIKETYSGYKAFEKLSYEPFID